MYNITGVSLQIIVLFLLFSAPTEGTLPPILVGAYDFIVVGAGASGSVVAARLVEKTFKTVLLLEGGEEGTGQRDVRGTDYVASYFKRDPVTGIQTLDTPLTRYDVPTMADSIRIASDVLDNMWPINATGPFFTQAKVVGGNQATNGLAWTPVLKRNIDEWGIPGYNGSDFWKYLKRVENATEAGYGNSPNRGNSGPINIKFSTFMNREQLRFKAACNAAGYLDQGDINDGEVFSGVYQCQTNVKAGIRQSSSVAYLGPILKKKPFNFFFRPGSIVTRVIFNHAKVATGVEFVKNGVLYKALATKEVILAAGDLQVAKLLMYSGIGPISTLNAFKITPVVVNELVGQKIRNHQRIAIRYNDSSIVNANYYVTPAASVEFARAGSGIQEGRGFYFLFFNSTNCTSRCPDLQATAGASAGATSGDYYSQSFSVTIAMNYNLYANGTLNLTSSNPLATTAFRANILLLDEDVRLLAKGIIQTRQVMNSWDGNLIEVAPGPTYDTEDKLIPWIRTFATTTCHYYGSAPMGSSVTNSVTDARMRVHGVTRLRVVGPSVIPAPIFPSMQLMANALGEKGAELIIQDL